MTDPWKDIRTRTTNWQNCKHIVGDHLASLSLAKAPEDREGLLADADALLALVVPAQEAFDYFEAYDQPEWFEALERALSGLSAHLKGE